MNKCTPPGIKIVARSLDTNVLIRLCVGDVPVQSRAAMKLIESDEELCLADAVLIETIFVLSINYQLPRGQVVDTLQKLLSHPNLICNRELFGTVLAHFLKHPGLSVVDCYLAEVAYLNGAAPLLTFDKKLAAQLQHAELLKT